MHIGYARVSTQDLRLQYAALQAAGCDHIYADKASGATASRDGLTRALAILTSPIFRISFYADVVGYIRTLSSNTQGLAVRMRRAKLRNPAAFGRLRSRNRPCIHRLNRPFGAAHLFTGGTKNS